MSERDTYREQAEEVYPCRCELVYTRNGRHDPKNDCPEVQDDIAEALRNAAEEERKGQPVWSRDLEANVEWMRRELAALREDKERLDWLEENWDWINTGRTVSRGTLQAQFSISDAVKYAARAGHRAPLRAAIDEARGTQTENPCHPECGWMGSTHGGVTYEHHPDCTNPAIDDQDACQHPGCQWTEPGVWEHHPDCDAARGE
jgi:hypothetical protein